MQTIIPFIWFEGTAEDAMNYYVETFPNTEILSIDRYTGDQGIPYEQDLKGKVLNAEFKIGEQKFQCLDGPSVFSKGGNISFIMEFDAQEELDKVWEKLLDGGKTQQCGWITDKFGITWQILPKVLGELLSDQAATPEQKQAVMTAMLKMVKLDGPKLKEAFDAAK